MSDRIVDLSLTFKDGMRGVSFTNAATIATNGYCATNMLLYSHAGTHLDAPAHSIEGGGTIESLDLQKCIGPALVIDMSHKGKDSLLSIADFEPFAERIQAGSRLLVRTDWDLHADLPDYRDSFPRISLELAEWLTKRQIWLLGLETPSIASLTDKGEMIAVHQMMLQEEIVIVESLSRLRDLEQDEVYFVGLPLKIDKGDGSPIRAIAIERP